MRAHSLATSGCTENVGPRLLRIAPAGPRGSQAEASMNMKLINLDKPSTIATLECVCGAGALISTEVVAPRSLRNSAFAERRKLSSMGLSLGEKRE